MKLLSKIVSVVVIIVGLATLYFTHQLSVQRGILRVEKANLATSLTITTNKLIATEGFLRDTTAALTTTTNKLIATEAALDATNKVLVATSEERDKLKTDLASTTDQLKAVNTELASTKNALKKSEETVAAQVAQIDDCKKQITTLTQENKALGGNLEIARSEVKRLTTENEDLRVTGVTTRGQIAATEDRWNFVVLNVGQNQKVRLNTEFLVYRGNKFICKVLTISVSPNTSVAQILPEFKKDAPRPGDLVFH